MCRLKIKLFFVLKNSYFLFYDKTDPPSSAASRGLILVAKILQIAASHVNQTVFAMVEI
jgi:hypothetical protein